MSRPEGPPADHAEPVPTVLVGFGRMAQGYSEDPKLRRNYRYSTHAEVLGDHPAFEWVGVVDPADEPRRKARDRWGVPDVAEALEDVEEPEVPEIAVIATPPDVRLEVLKAFPNLRAVLVEKPLGPSMSEAIRFLEDCRRRGILVQVNLWRRADRLYRSLADSRLKELVGTPHAAFALYGNGLQNHGTHLVDLVEMLLGPVETVDAMEPGPETRTTPSPRDDEIPFHLTLESGLGVSVQTVDFDSYREGSLDIWGSTGRFCILEEGLTNLHHSVRPHPAMTGETAVTPQGTEIEPTVGEALYDLYTNLSRGLELGEPLWAAGERGVRAMSLVDAVLRSAESGEPATVPGDGRVMT